MIPKEHCFLQPVNVSDHLDLIHSYESESYPSDEAATFEKLKYRLLNANDVFRGYFYRSPSSNEFTPLLLGEMSSTKNAIEFSTETDPNTSHNTSSLQPPLQPSHNTSLLQPLLIGFVCGTKTNAHSLTHQSMSINDPNGRTLCIHSVVIKKEFRNCGLGLDMLQLYLNYLKENSICDQVLLITKKHLIHFYEKAGFKLNGESNVVHGQEKWYEMSFNLKI
ncbi:hypothetical protein FDP41_010856 [Naegleria fowleri]|uniref:N-acetyltransferase domain-containing protein n=1 Tax=Naegleria fowleri TaxID=5763 RepID=A0A6A5C072_NAEFO|nr:uncharacterized protein FDP41_010856 [Naegleria fowleri]KAF0982877.1 hypothetical protein FDP41_010856 [Naegleria fowleri]CAG4719680.1 unnamed protein product [Naegleria fowleri]